jgi:anthranilate phosphoribosyltransferase
MVTPNDVVTRAIDAVCAGDHLTSDHAAAVLAEIMEGRAGEVQTGAFLIALRAKGETVPELVGLARTMRSLATPVATHRDDLVDTAGTGGGPSTFNVSTTAALVAAGAGCAVAKHGNRSNTSRCGSADLLEALGVNIDLDPAQVGRCIDELGFGFMFAQSHHPAMKHAAPVRRELGTRTVFNVLGPLTNPAGARAQVIGVFAPSLVRTIGEVVAQLGAERAFVVHGFAGIDELSPCGPNLVAEVRGGEVVERVVDPRDLGFEPRDTGELAGGTAAENAEAIRGILAGEVQDARRDAVLLNAAGGIAAAGDAADLAEGLRRARETLDSGAAAERLEQLVAFSRSAV